MHPMLLTSFELFLFFVFFFINKTILNGLIRLNVIVFTQGKHTDIEYLVLNIAESGKIFTVKA